MRKRRFYHVLAFLGIAILIAGNALAAATASWIAPPDSSSYLAGTSVDLLGNGNGSGMTGGTGLDLMMVIDTSGSMAGSKLTAAKSASVALINSLPLGTTQVGIIEYDWSANVYRQLQNLTTNKTDLINAINALTAGGNTATGPAILAATAELTGIRAIAGHSKMEVVLSDGMANVGLSPLAAATQAWGQGVQVNTVGVPGHNPTEMQGIATNGHGIYTNASDLSTLEALFAGTAGNLVGLDYIDLLMPDGTLLHDIAHDTLGNFTIDDYTVALGANTFQFTAYATDGTSASASLTIYGTPHSTPEPATLLLLGLSMVGLVGVKRRFMK